MVMSRVMRRPATLAGLRHDGSLRGLNRRIFGCSPDQRPPLALIPFGCCRFFQPPSNGSSAKPPIMPFRPDARGGCRGAIGGACFHSGERRHWCARMRGQAISNGTRSWRSFVHRRSQDEDSDRSYSRADRSYLRSRNPPARVRFCLVIRAARFSS